MTQNEGISAVAAIHDPVRRELLRLASASSEPMTRDAAAEALGVSRSTVAFHLDRLVDAGLLEVRFERVNGRTGPGAGRPSKAYSRVPGEVSVSIPERHYDLMGDLLATAVETAGPHTSARESLRAVATAAGHSAGVAAGTFERVLEQSGYEPIASERGTELINCPFHRLAQSHTDVVCTANHAFLCEAAAATDVDTDAVILDPEGGRCCVRIQS